MGRKPRGPVIEFNGERYVLCSSGHYKGYYRKTTGDREMLHRAVWRSGNKGKEIPGGHVIHIAGNDRTCTDPGMMELLRDGEHISARRRPLELKRCIQCGEIMGRKFGAKTECPSAYARRLTCSPQCSAAWKRGRPKGSRMPR